MARRPPLLARLRCAPRPVDEDHPLRARPCPVHTVVGERQGRAVVSSDPSHSSRAPGVSRVVDPAIGALPRHQIGGGLLTDHTVALPPFGNSMASSRREEAGPEAEWVEAPPRASLLTPCDRSRDTRLLCVELPPPVLTQCTSQRDDCRQLSESSPLPHHPPPAARSRSSGVGPQLVNCLAWATLNRTPAKTMSRLSDVSSAYRRPKPVDTQTSSLTLNSRPADPSAKLRSRTSPTGRSKRHRPVNSRNSWVRAPPNTTRPPRANAFSGSCEASESRTVSCASVRI